MSDLTTSEHDPSCDVAHGTSAVPRSAEDKVLIAVYASPLASCLLRWGAELGFRTLLVEPDPSRVTDGLGADPGPDVTVLDDPAAVEVDARTDVVVTDHHRDDLGPVMAPLVTAVPRWIGIIGSPRHAGPHVAALAAEGVDADTIATVRRPIGVDIGSKTPPEIALSILAGLLADRNGRAAGLPQRPATGAVAP